MTHRPIQAPWRHRLPRAAALAACALLTTQLATAQADAPTPPTVARQAPQGAAPSAQPAGRTRAEVIAELVCARASGELEAMALQSYGLGDARPIDRSVPECAPAAGGKATR
ncbi:DUF4148 domain-containing protein [Acidovorax sp. NCPPB 2350]|nr:DUF4148 domain-containing protein [Acidovorax sp. NCPPB 2350]